MFMVDYATHSIFAAVMGFLCGIVGGPLQLFFWPYGFWCGYLAYKELPHRRNQAIVGMVLNGFWCVLFVLVLAIIYRISLSTPAAVVGAAIVAGIVLLVFFFLRRPRRLGPAQPSPH